MNLKICTRRIKGIPVLEMRGEITRDSLKKVTMKLNGLKRKNARIIVIDLSNTQFIDSHGLGAFVFFRHKMAEENKELIFYKPVAFVRQLLAETSLAKIFRIIESEEEL